MVAVRVELRNDLCLAGLSVPPAWFPARSGARLEEGEFDDDAGGVAGNEELQEGKNRVTRISGGSLIETT